MSDDCIVCKIKSAVESAYNRLREWYSPSLDPEEARFHNQRLKFYEKMLKDASISGSVEEIFDDEVSRKMISNIPFDILELMNMTPDEHIARAKLSGSDLYDSFKESGLSPDQYFEDLEKSQKPDDVLLYKRWRDDMFYRSREQQELGEIMIKEVCLTVEEAEAELKNQKPL